MDGGFTAGISAICGGSCSREAAGDAAPVRHIVGVTEGDRVDELLRGRPQGGDVRHAAPDGGLTFHCQDAASG